MKKLKVVLNNEFSGVSSGYGTIGLEILKRLHATKKYDIYEFATYLHPADQRIQSVPWGIYGSGPANEKENEEYKAHPQNQFGRAKFEEMLISCQPDVVLSIRDVWMDEYIMDSPLRKYFQWIYMPTADSAPHQEEWLNIYGSADRLITYSDFAKRTIEEQTAGKVKVFDVVGGGADKNKFTPSFNKAKIRQEFGLGEDLFIIGTIMRNQKRKLFDDLLKAFEIYIKKAPEALAKKTYMYWHTSHPDVGWDFALMLKNSPVGHKILFTYSCKACGNVFIGFFQDCDTFCPKCKQRACSMPKTDNGISSEMVAKISQLFDCYVQYAICEGIGIPGVENGVAGIPVFMVDYSGMEDFKYKIGGTPVNVKQFFLESETHAYRCYPDNDDLANKLLKFANLPKQLRDKKAFTTHQMAVKNFDYDVITKRWEKVIDSCVKMSWEEKPDIKPIPNGYPNGLNNEQFVRWCIVNVLNKPELLDGYYMMRLIKDLNYGKHIHGRGGMYLTEMSLLSFEPRWREFNQETCFNDLKTKREEINRWEAIRCNLAPRPRSVMVEYHKEPNND